MSPIITIRSSLSSHYTAGVIILLALWSRPSNSFPLSMTPKQHAISRMMKGAQSPSFMPRYFSQNSHSPRGIKTRLQYGSCNQTDVSPTDYHSFTDVEESSFQRLRDLEALLDSNNNDIDKHWEEELSKLEDLAATTSNFSQDGPELGIYDPLHLTEPSSTLSARSATDLSSSKDVDKSPQSTNDDKSSSSSSSSWITVTKDKIDSLLSSRHDGEGKVMFARILLLCAAALYGTNFALVKILDDHVPVGAATSLRFILAAVVATPWLLPKIRRNDSDKDIAASSSSSDQIMQDAMSWGPTVAGMEVGLWNSVGYIAQAVGLQTVDASKSAFICSLAVVCVPILDALTGRVLSLKKIFGILMAVSGVAVLELGDSFLSTTSTHLPPSIHTGDMISLLQPLAFGIGFWRMEHATTRYPEETARLTSSQLFAVALASVTYCLAGGGGVAPPSLDQVIGWVTDVHILGALAWTGIVTTALTIFMEVKALQTVSASEATLIFSTEPIWGSAFASVVVGEHLGIEAGVGAAMILGGCLVSSLTLGNNNSDDGSEVAMEEEKAHMDATTTEPTAVVLNEEQILVSSSVGSIATINVLSPLQEVAEACDGVVDEVIL